MGIDKKIRTYLNEIRKNLDSVPINQLNEFVEIIYDAYRRDRQLFIMGNGGSASTASHFACDLGKNTNVVGKKRFRVISLNDNISLITALSNDFGYESVFIEQLKNLVNPGDIVIAITASGNSTNIIKAVKYARSKKALTLGLLGFDGGKLKNLLDKSIVLKSRDYGIVESVHSAITHIITSYFRELFMGKNRRKRK